MLPSYRNQSIDLSCKSIDRFLYEGNTGIPRAMMIVEKHGIDHDVTSKGWISPFYK